MKHVVAVWFVLFSMVFLMGDSCDSGDFSTSYMCCGQDPNCTQTTCAASDCSTGVQTFQNGQNECAILQTDASNNNCALQGRFAEYINIGCTGTFTENPAMPAPTLALGPAAAAGSGIINLTWTPPVLVPSSLAGSPSNVQLAYTVLVGTASLAEGFWTTDVTGGSYSVQGLVSGATYFFVITANQTFAGNLAAPGVTSNEVTAIAP
jgi:hypothetical protein